MSRQGGGLRSLQRRCDRWLPPTLTAVAPWHLSAAVFLAFLGLYGATLLPGVLPADSGEFQAVAAKGGVAHPPGYPLYTVLGWLSCRVPLGPTPAWRVNALSVVTAAATVTLVFSTGREITHSVLGGLTAALTLGSATTFWATATKASIRPLTALFAALCIYALVRHRSQVERRDGGAHERYLVLFFLSLSLGLTHHPSLAFPGSAFVLYLVLIDPKLVREPGRWPRLLVAILPGLLVLVYLPIRGAPDLATASGFLDHVLARGFRGDMFALSLLDRLVLLPTLLRFQFNGVLLLGMALGALLLLWHDRRLALLLIGSFVVHTLVMLTYDAPQTVEYGMPAYVSLALLMAVPAGQVAHPESRTPDLRSLAPRLKVALSILGYLAALALLAAPVASLYARLPSYRALSDSRDTRNYVETVLREAPEGAIVLSNWHWFTPLNYVRQIEQVRPDVGVEYVEPRGEPLAQTWAHTIKEHVNERPVVVARAFETQYEALPYTFEPLGEAFLVRSEPRLDLPTDMVPVEEVLDDRIQVLGYRLDTSTTEPAQPVTIDLAWSPTNVPSTGFALFAQLIGPDGDLWSAAEDPRHSPTDSSSGEIVVDRVVVYPRLHAPPGPYTLVVGAYASEGRFTTADGSDTIALGTVRLQPSSNRPITQHPRLIAFGVAPTLIGVDYETGAAGGVRTYLHWAGPGELAHVQLMSERDSLVTLGDVPALKRGQYATVAVDRPALPSHMVVLQRGGRDRNPLGGKPIRLPAPNPGERYVPFGDGLVLTHLSGPADPLEPGGEALLSLRLRSQRPLQRDYIVSTSLTGLRADGTWAWRASHDTVPALGAIPTLKWIRGSSVVDPHLIQVPENASAVPIVGSVLFYDHFTQRILPDLDGRYETVVQLGTWHLSQ